MRDLRNVGKHKVVVGVIHVGPLPGTPFYDVGSLGRILDDAVSSARALRAGGADGCLVQTADRVHSIKDDSDPARTSAMTLIADAIRKENGEDFQVGVQLMQNAIKASLAVAKVVKGTFIRAGALVGMTLTPHGLVEANPFDVMSYRKHIGADDIAVIADIESVDFHWFGEATVAQVAKAATLVGADAVALGHPSESKTLLAIADVRRAVPQVPIVLAAHTNHDNVARLMAAADGAFVRTCFEQNSLGGHIDVDRVRRYVDIVRSLEQ